MQKQQGFTLIELIVVIVILGILAATALPRFANLQGDARFASVQAAQGALRSASAITHGTFLARNTPAAGVVQIEAQNATNTNGYPLAAEMGQLAGLGVSGESYTITVATPTVTVSPVGVANVATCNVTYTESVGGGAAPAITLTASANGCL
jgi:MSHA pilin protein MshA